MSKAKKKYRIKSKTRFLIFMTIMFTLLIGGAGTLIGANNAVSMTKPQFREIQIHQGDTLWNIATEYKLKEQDTRSVIYEICDINKVAANNIQPGQKLLIPIYF